eukprot:scpid110800/ scgid33648/ 
MVQTTIGSYWAVLKVTSWCHQGLRSGKMALAASRILQDVRIRLMTIMSRKPGPDTPCSAETAEETVFVIESEVITADTVATWVGKKLPKSVDNKFANIQAAVHAAV